MSIPLTHKPNYFLCAQLVIRHIENYISKNTDATNVTFDLGTIYELFRQDLASATTNLDGIMNIADEYRVETLQGDETLIREYKINAQENSLFIEFNPNALNALNAGKKIIVPDATLQE
jgi:hypothetical protein